jgi:site-specific recombinase XerD
MAEPKNYHEQTQIDNTLRLREILKTLPPFAKDYFRAIEPRSSSRTRINYAYDIRVFFNFLIEVNPYYKNYTIDMFKLDDLDRIEPVDIEEYMEYLKVYTRSHDEELITNSERGLKRKMSALRSFYNYYFKRQSISKNPTLLVNMPKLHDKAIIRLDADEVAMLISGGDEYVIRNMDEDMSLIDRMILFLLNPFLQSIFMMMIVGGIFVEIRTPGVGVPLMIALVGAVLRFQ